MKALRIIGRILIVLVSIVMLGVSATLAWGAVIDFQARGLVPTGVTIVGHNLSGMTETQARATIENAVSTPLLRPVTITGDGKTWTLDPKGIVSIDVGYMLAEAYSPRRTATFAARLNSELTGKPLPADIQPAYSVDSTVVATWVAQAATQIDRAPVSSTRRIVKYAFKIKPAVYGAKMGQGRARVLIAQALTAEAALASADRTVALPIKSLQPRTLESSFKTAIIVSLSECRIRLYNGAKLVKAYACAPGQPAWPTPKGDFKIISKQVNAPWINPKTPWAASMPPMIPGGPGNPMGDRKIGIDFSGVFFHGVPPGEYGSIGSHASHGCMRMMPDQVHDLYGRVRLGDQVFIRE